MKLKGVKEENIEVNIKILKLGAINIKEQCRKWNNPKMMLKIDQKKIRMKHIELNFI